VATLQAGTPRDGNVAVIAAGTGLGEAIVFADGARRLVIATEGGHADFAPRGEIEEELLRYLRKEFGRVSYERVLSGPGLVNVYRFLRDTGAAPESSEVAAVMRERDPAAVITEYGVRGADRLCVAALGIFASVYGAEAGNLALKALATGGVIVAGGIAPRIMSTLASGGFVSAFRDKGRLSPLLEAMPVRVALDPKMPLHGAARVAMSL
jgi:glucokinase